MGQMGEQRVSDIRGTSKFLLLHRLQDCNQLLQRSRTRDVAAGPSFCQLHNAFLGFRHTQQDDFGMTVPSVNGPYEFQGRFPVSVKIEQDGLKTDEDREVRLCKCACLASGFFANSQGHGFSAVAGCGEYCDFVGWLVWGHLASRSMLSFEEPNWGAHTDER